LHWEKSIPSNLFWIAEIPPINRSSDKQGLTVFGIDSGIDLIVSLLLGTAHLLHHNCCFFLWTWCWKDT